MDTEKNNYDVKKILKYNGKLILICNVILIICTIISLLLVKVTDSLSLILAGVFVFYMLIFLIIDIANRLRSKIALKKYNLDEIKKELANAKTRKIDGIETYLTENYIVTNAKVIRITKYKDIAWTYLDKPLGMVHQKAMIGVAYKIGGTPVIAYSKDGKKVVIALVKKEEQLKELYGAILSNNKKVLIGDTYENHKAYEKINKNFRIGNKIGSIFVCILFILIIIGAIYYYFFLK